MCFDTGQQTKDIKKRRCRVLKCCGRHCLALYEVNRSKFCDVETCGLSTRVSPLPSENPQTCFACLGLGTLTFTSKWEVWVKTRTECFNPPEDESPRVSESNLKVSIRIWKNHWGFHGFLKIGVPKNYDVPMMFPLENTEKCKDWMIVESRI